MMGTGDNFGIYIHVPFCRSKCIYCGFYSVATLQKKEAYFSALHQEIDLRASYIQQHDLRTIYFGGGTPSLLTGEELTGIISHLRQRFSFSNLEEITLEANPEQLTEEYCRQLHDVGINRLSIGVQSFQDHVLQFMGRKHTAAEAMTAVRNAQRVGFENISVDLIYGVSERSDELWREDLSTAFSLNVQHLSCYALTPEENSILYKQIANHKHAPVDDEQAARQYDILQQALPHSGFTQYEVSNFAKPGFESKHNSSYWDHTPYLGLGPSAHSFDGRSRQWNSANITQYCKDIQNGDTCAGNEDLEEIDLFNEHVLLRLRTREGLSIPFIRDRFGEERANGLMNYFENIVPSNRYEKTADSLRLTAEGLWFADGIAEDAFIVED